MGMDITEILKSYHCGNYNYCIHIFSEDSLHHDKWKTVKEFSKTVNLNDTAAAFLIENNYIVCQAIIESRRNDHQKWLELLQRFCKLYSNYKSLLVIPLELEMNVIYNMLWWLWIKPQSVPNATYHLMSVLKSVSCCLIKVLKSNGEVVLGQQMCWDDVTSFVNLLKRASDQLLCLKPIACMQLLDIITITVQVFLRLRVVEAAAECMAMMRKIVNQIDLLRLHTERNKSADDEEVFFKFGLKSINSTASLKNCRDSIDTCVITSSLVYTMNEEYEQAICCLKGMDEDNSSFNFMMNYLKAHCCLMSQHYSEAKLCLAYVMSGPVAPLHLAHYRVLLARLLGAQGDHQAAIVHCDTVLAAYSPHVRLTSLAAHLAAQQANKLSLTTAELNYLKQLVQGLKTGMTEDHGYFESFEECCLLTVAQQFPITLAEALYSLARQLYLTGYHVKSLDSYKELIELVKLQACEAPSLLPCISQLVQECVLAHIKSNSLPEGEQLCRQLVRDHLPHTGRRQEFQSVWEVTLYSIEDDVISLLLLADILSAAGNKRRALEELNRCQSAVTEWRDQNKSETETQLCDWLLCRVLLRKAKLSSITDAVHYFRRALLHKPGDKESMFHYKQWSLWHPDHDSFDPGDAASAITFPVDEIHNLAVRHILGSSVSEEEWNHLFDKETSQNIIESLFDDDD